MTNFYEIAFYCNADANEGIGHFFRCLRIANLISNDKIVISFYGKFNSIATEQLKYYRIPSYNSDLQKVLKFSFKIDCLFVDTYLIDQQHVNMLCEKYKVIFIDDFNSLDFNRAYGIYNFTVNASNLDYNCGRMCLGPNFFPFKKEFISIRQNNLELKRIISNNVNLKLLFFFSGTNLNNAKIIDILLIFDKLYVNSEFILLLNQNILNINKYLKYNRINHIKKTKLIERLYEKVDLLISGGGLAKYEAGFCAIPNFSLAVNATQHKETILLESRNLTYEIGSFFDLDSQYTENRVKEFHMDKTWQMSFYDASGNNFESNLEKVKNNILKSLDL